MSWQTDRRIGFLIKVLVLHDMQRMVEQQKKYNYSDNEMKYIGCCYVFLTASSPWTARKISQVCNFLQISQIYFHFELSSIFHYHKQTNT